MFSKIERLFESKIIHLIIQNFPLSFVASTIEINTDLFFQLRVWIFKSMPRHEEWRTMPKEISKKNDAGQKLVINRIRELINCNKSETIIIHFKMVHVTRTSYIRHRQTHTVYVHISKLRFK